MEQKFEQESEESVENVKMELKTMQENIKNLKEIVNNSLNELDKNVSDLLYKIDNIEYNNEKISYLEKQGLVPTELIDMSPSLAKTIKVLLESGKAMTADEVKKLTGRSRSIESNYLNSLYRSGKVEKERGSGRMAYYKLKFK